MYLLRDAILHVYLLLYCRVSCSFAVCPPDPSIRSGASMKGSREVFVFWGSREVCVFSDFSVGPVCSDFDASI